MAHSYEAMMNPSVEELLDTIDSKFILVTLAAKRSREITDYLGQGGVGIGAIAPPQVETQSAKPLSIALEEIAAGKIQASEDNAEASEDDSEAPEDSRETSADNLETSADNPEDDEV